MEVNLENTYWDRVEGYPTEFRVDARWILRKKDDDRTYGSLRIVSHPDLPPGHLKSFYTQVTFVNKKDQNEILQSTVDYEMDEEDLEVYSVSENIKTEDVKYDAPMIELEKLYNVKIFS